MTENGKFRVSTGIFRLFPMATLAVLCALTLLFSSCASFNSNPLKGMGPTTAGNFTRLDSGMLYLPSGWTSAETWPVTVVLHGYGELSLGLSAKYFWKDWAERYGIVLFFPETGHMGWHEDPSSDDTRQLLAVFRFFRKTSWVKKDGIQLFGWSAGSIMALDLVALNRETRTGAELFDRAVIFSGGFGTPMDERLRKDPKLTGISRTPIFFAWGEAEGADHGRDASATLAGLGWNVETATHPGGHYIDPELSGIALSRNRR
jgi:predicted esterase